jgi:cell division protein FtsX
VVQDPDPPCQAIAPQRPSGRVLGSLPVSGDDVGLKAASDWWRNHLMTKAGVLIVVVWLTLVSATLLSWQGAASASGAPNRGTEVTVWMEPDASAQEIHAVGSRLSQLRYVRHPCAYWNKAQNFAEARKLLPTDVIGRATVKEMPTSFWCTPVASADADQVIRTMNGTPGIKTVTVGHSRSEPRRS